MLVQVDSLLYQLNSDSEGDEGSDIGGELEEDDEEAEQGSGAASSGEGQDDSASESQDQAAAAADELPKQHADSALCTSTDTAVQGLAANPEEADTDVQAARRPERDQRNHDVRADTATIRHNQPASPSKSDHGHNSRPEDTDQSAQDVPPGAAQHAHSDHAQLPAAAESGSSRAGHPDDAAVPSHSQLQQGSAASTQGLAAPAQGLSASCQVLVASGEDGEVSMAPPHSAATPVTALPSSAAAGHLAQGRTQPQPVPAALPAKTSGAGQKGDAGEAAGAFACSKSSYNGTFTRRRAHALYMAVAG